MKRRNWLQSHLAACREWLECDSAGCVSTAPICLYISLYRPCALCWRRYAFMASVDWWRHTESLHSTWNVSSTTLGRATGVCSVSCHLYLSYRSNEVEHVQSIPFREIVLSIMSTFVNCYAFLAVDALCIYRCHRQINSPVHKFFKLYESKFQFRERCRRHEVI